MSENPIIPSPEEVIPYAPAVYAVRREYQIIVPVSCETLMWCEVGGESYYDDFSGVLRSAERVHRMTVPQAELDRCRHYTLCYRQVFQRKPYFSETGDVVRCEYDFRPVEGPEIRIGMLADCHNLEDSPIAAIRSCGKLDLLLLNGDIPDNGGEFRCFASIFRIAGEIGRGEIPMVFARGNHDLRGTYAEKLENSIPTDCGRTYFTFRLGPIWGIVLDCAEDKMDDNEAYGNTNACHAFRIRETKWLKQVIANAGEEYGDADVKYRLVVCHIPFSEKNEPPFNIEEEIYGEWCRLLKEQVKPDLMLCGHIHEAYVTMPGDPKDYLGQPCPLIVGSMLHTVLDEDNELLSQDYAGTFLKLMPDQAEYRLVHQSGTVLQKMMIEFRQDQDCRSK